MMHCSRDKVSSCVDYSWPPCFRSFGQRADQIVYRTCSCLGATPVVPSNPACCRLHGSPLYGVVYLDARMDRCFGLHLINYVVFPILRFESRYNFRSLTFRSFWFVCIQFDNR